MIYQAVIGEWLDQNIQLFLCGGQWQKLECVNLTVGTNVLWKPIFTFQCQRMPMK